VTNSAFSVQREVANRTLVLRVAYQDGIGPVVPPVCSADLMGSVTRCQGIRGYTSVTATLKFTCLLIKRIMSC
jgi:hypothetical protein